MEILKLTIFNIYVKRVHTTVHACTPHINSTVLKIYNYDTNMLIEWCEIISLCSENTYYLFIKHTYVSRSGPRLKPVKHGLWTPENILIQETPNFLKVCFSLVVCVLNLLSLRNRVRRSHPSILISYNNFPFLIINMILFHGGVW